MRTPDPQIIPPKRFQRVIVILYAAMVFSIVVIPGVLIYMRSISPLEPMDFMVKFYVILLPISIVVAVPLGARLLKTNLQQLAPETPLDQKLSRYLGLYILRMAILQTPNLLGAMAYFQTGARWTIMFCIASFLLYVYYRPTEERVSKELGLNPEERQKIYG